MAARKKERSRTALYISVIVLIILLIISYKIFGPNTGTFTHGDFLYVHTGSDYEQLKKALEEGGFVADMTSFDILARRAGLPSHVHPGKYKINDFMSNYRLIRLLHSGKQVQVNLIISKIRTERDFITLLSTNLEADSLTLKQMLHDPEYLSQFGLDTNTVMCAVIPNTYFFKWNTTADKAFRKIEENYNRFWNDARKQEAREHGLTPVKAVIVASIVDEETNLNEDKPNIASVYINRLGKGMKLQADPTVKFAVGDFTIKRIAGAMMSNRSPYNTYLYEGLPPGPICTPATSTVEAVLQAPKTNYLYFCANADFSGRSSFASTYEQQLKNARAYQQALNARGIH